MKRPPVRCAKTADGFYIAYTTVGDAAVDVVFLPEAGAAIDALWEHPGHLRWWRYHESFCRMIVHDPRGLGVSDPVTAERVADLDDWVEDTRAVMDAAGVDDAVILGEGFRAQTAIAFAAAYPERTRRLVLLNGYSHWTREGGRDWLARAGGGSLATVADRIAPRWGTGSSVAAGAPNLAGDRAFLEWAGRMERLNASPTIAASLALKMRSSDVRHMLPTIETPTLVVYTGDLAHTPVESSRYLCEHIAGARLLEVPPTKSFYLIDPEPGNEYESFITGGAPSAVRERELATLLFTDIVGSTVKAAEFRDEKWRTVLEDLDNYVRSVIERPGGRIVKQTGDGHLLAFARPSDALQAAMDLQAGVRVLGVELRMGVHTGELEWRGDDAVGIAVHIAARVMDRAGPGAVLVSSSVPPLVAGSGIEFEDRGTHELKGVPGSWQLYEMKA